MRSRCVPSARGSSPLARGSRHGQFSLVFALGLIPARAGLTVRACDWRDRRWAHPRSRGAHRAASIRSTGRLGSSPLARGSRVVENSGSPEVGLIPARAGLTSTAHRGWARSRAHPRSRGAHRQSQAQPSKNKGSSPLARGSPLATVGAGMTAGLIPARAGLTPAGSGGSTPSAAHPRSRGAHAAIFGVRAVEMGSSPLARGSPPPASPQQREGGLIPARAGLTSSATGPPPSTRAHPRSRGAHPASQPAEPGDVGSSPLARGSLDGAGQACGDVGLIPARAGLTAPEVTEWTGARAHPRSRGAHRPLTDEQKSRGGSSPLARGSHRPPWRPGVHGGLIPARAGLTSADHSKCSGDWAHPRSRGAHPANWFSRSSERGSSPLARGSPCSRGRTPTVQGLIPARAGLTLVRVLTCLKSWAHPRSRGAHVGRHRRRSMN